MSDLLNCTTSGQVNGTSCGYDTNISGGQIVQGMIINLVIGCLCYVGFVLWRDKFRIYFNRLYLPQVAPEQRPPELDTSGMARFWSWLGPVFTVSDKKLLESAGLDALIAQRIIGFGCLVFLPMTILGVGVLIPVNYTAYDGSTTEITTDNTTTIVNTDAFLRMAMSAIPKGSNLLWIHFTFTYIFIAWVCWLLVQYYKEFISLRQAYDDQLVRSAQIGQRTSLLDDAQQGSQPPGSGSQIVSTLRRKLSIVGSAGGGYASGSIASGFGGGGGGGGGRQDAAGRLSVLSSLEQRSADMGSGNQALGSGPTGGGGLVSRPLPPDVLSDGSGSSSLPAGKLADDTSSGSTGGSRPADSLRSRFALAAAEAEQLGRPGGAGSEGLLPRHSPNLEGIAEAADGEEECSPRDVAGAGQEAGAGSGAMPAASAAAAAAEAGDGKQPVGSEVMAVGALLPSPFQGSSSLSKGVGALEWDELSQTYPDMQAADAAQFYTVLVVDEALEEFSYRHEDRPWVWKLPEKLASTPRSSKAALDAIFQESKALARLNSKKARENLEACERRMQVAEEAYREIFGSDFDRIVPVYNPKPADALLWKWHLQRARLDRLRLQHWRLEERIRTLQEQQGVWQGQAAEEGQQAAAQLQQKGDQLSLQVSQKEQQQQQRQELKEGQQKEQQQQQKEEEQQQSEHAETRDVEAGASRVTVIAEDGSGGQPGGGGSCLDWLVCVRQPPAEELSPEQAAQRAAKRAQQAQRRAERDAKQLAQLEGRLEKKREEVRASENALADLQGRIEEAQLSAAEGEPAPCFFATFRTAQAAAYAARLNLNPMHQRMMRVLPAPAPNNVNYSALLRGWMSRGSRPMVVFIFVLFMLLFPIGTFAGVCGSIVNSVCGTLAGDTTSFNANNTWFCSSNSFAAFLRTLISSIVPSILLSVWQALVLPQWFYNCAQAEACHFSFTSLDLRCAHWFFLHDLFNVFIGGMLGGSVIWGIRAVINDPSAFFTILGQAVPASSNFFVNYISFRGIAMAPFRLFFPHAIVFGGILKWLRIVPSPQTERDKVAAAPPISCRFSRDLGVLQLTVFVVSLGYAVVTPIILPLTLLYFLLTWPVWRYQMLYVYQGHYSCGGQFWVYAAHRIVICLGVMSAFTAALLAVKGGYVSALILFFTSIAWLIWFDRYLAFRYDAVVDQLPAVGILRAPPARVEDTLYVPPPMRPRGLGWNPEWGKAWYGYGVPRYGL